MKIKILGDSLSFSREEFFRNLLPKKGDNFQNTQNQDQDIQAIRQLRNLMKNLMRILM